MAQATGLPPAAKTRVEEAEEQLRMLLLKDTENHPDVIAQRKLIEFAEGGAAGRADGAGAGAAPRRAAARSRARQKRSVPNPVYDQLKVKLIDADSQVASLQRQRDAAVAYRDKLEKIQQEQPGLIAEYENTDRDYSVLRKSYEELLARLQSANIAQAADTQADKVKLQIVDPPEVPRLPVAPNRMLLVTGVLLAGLGARPGRHRAVRPGRQFVLDRGRSAVPRIAGARRHFRAWTGLAAPAADNRGTVWRCGRAAGRHLWRPARPHPPFVGIDLNGPLKIPPG